MSRLLYVKSSPRRHRSASNAVGDAYAAVWRERHVGGAVDVLDVWLDHIPEFGPEALAAKYAGLSGEALTGASSGIGRAIAQRFHDADAILIAAPMWNFGVPYKLKQLIDLISQKDILFRFDDSGFDGMLKGRTGVLALARGISYGPGEAQSEADFDFQKSYLEMWFAFVGITEVESVVVEKTLLGPDADAAARASGIERAGALAAR